MNKFLNAKGMFSKVAFKQQVPFSKRTQIPKSFDFQEDKLLSSWGAFESVSLVFNVILGTLIYSPFAVTQHSFVLCHIENSVSNLLILMELEILG